MISLYRPGNSLLHRIPAAPKFVVFLLGIAAISIFAKDAWSVASVLVVAIAAFFVAGLGIRSTLSLLWGLKALILFVLLPQLIFMTVPVALINAGRLLECVLFSMLLTMTTRTQDLLDLATRLLRPLRWVGLKPEIFGLLMAMTLNAISQIGGFMTEIREAQLARGLRPRASRVAVPLLVKSLKHSDDLAEALHARGVEL